MKYINISCEDAHTLSSVYRMCCRTVFVVCLSDVNVQRLMRAAGGLRMLGADFVYYTLSESVDDFVRQPWGERPYYVSDSQWRQHIQQYRHLRIVSKRVYFQ